MKEKKTSLYKEVKCLKLLLMQKWHFQSTFFCRPAATACILYLKKTFKSCLEIFFDFSILVPIFIQVPWAFEQARSFFRKLVIFSSSWNQR